MASRRKRVSRKRATGARESPAILSRAEQDAILDREIASFPATFGLRGHEGVFRISRRSSYFSSMSSTVPTLYTEKRAWNGSWSDFAKGTPSELRGQIVPIAQPRTTQERSMMASRRKQQHLPGIEPGGEPVEIEIPTMGWEQINGDVNPGAHGGTIATADGHSIELIKIQPVREYVGDDEAKDVGFPFWTKTAWFDLGDLDPNDDDVKSAMSYVGLDRDALEDMEPTQRALALADALLNYGRGDEGLAGWSADIGIPVKVKWWSYKRGEVAGPEYLADEDEAFRNEVLGYDDIRTAVEETVQRFADQSSAEAWSTLGDQALSDLEDQGYDPETAVDVAEFGDSVAVNGESTDETVHAVWSKLEADGYEETNFGGRIPSDEAYVSSDRVVSAVAKELGRPEEDVEKAAESLDWWQEEIPWSTSGDGSVWAKKKAGAEERRRTRRK